MDTLNAYDIIELSDDDKIQRLVAKINELVDAGDTSSKRVYKTVKVVAGDFDWYSVGNVGAAAFENGWVNYNATSPLRYRIDGYGNVFIQGEIKAGTLDVAAFTLPVGMRPFYNLTFSSIGNDVTSKIVVQSDGQVIAGKDFIGSDVWMSMNIPPFPAANQLPNPSYSGDEWPIYIEHELGKVDSVLCVYARIENQNKNEPVICPSICWDNAGDGRVVIKSANNLASGSRYSLTFMISGDGNA